MSLDREWITVPECCQYMRRSRWTIYAYIHRGLITASQITPGANILIRRRSVEDLMQRRINRPVPRQVSAMSRTAHLTSR
jgi:excisionase family DNA binding protein